MIYDSVLKGFFFFFFFFKVICYDSLCPCVVVLLDTTVQRKLKIQFVEDFSNLNLRQKSMSKTLIKFSSKKEGKKTLLIKVPIVYYFFPLKATLLPETLLDFKRECVCCCTCIILFMVGFGTTRHICINCPVMENFCNLFY